MDGAVITPSSFREFLAKNITADASKSIDGDEKFTMFVSGIYQRLDSPKGKFCPGIST